MPLVRLQVRNEFGLGQPELYREANREDPKAVLDGVAVAGLVGILRQLGDLADFAAEVFHGLQEQVMTTSSRSRRLMVRVQNIEASLPPLEKAVLAQTSHIHFAYTSGCEWHPRIKTARNHFIYNDLPHFIMESYEECHDPPRLHLLDKFDTGGPGSCFKRYSDPAFFKKASADSDVTYFEKTEKARKSHKSKKKRSSRKNGEISRREKMHSSSGRMQFIPPTANGRLSSSQSATTIDMKMKSDMEVRSSSFDSRAGAGYIECVFHPSYSVQSNEQDHGEPPSSRLTQKTTTFQSVPPHIDDSVSHGSLEKKIGSSSSGATWDEKEEIMESTSQASVKDNTPDRLQEKHDYGGLANEGVNVPNADCHDILADEESNLKPASSRVQTDDIDSEPDSYVDALNTIESETVESEFENDFAYETKHEEQEFTSPVIHGMIENEVTEAPPNIFNNDLCDAVTQNGYVVSLNKETGEDFPEEPQENHPLISEPHEPELASVSPSDVPHGEETIGDTDSLNKEIFSNLPEPDSLQDHSVRSDPHEPDLGPLSPSDAPDGNEMTSETLSLNNDTFGNIPGSPQKIAHLASVSDTANLASMGQLDFPASDEITNVDDSHSFESPIGKQVPLTCENSVSEHSVCTDSFVRSDTVKESVLVDDTFSAHIETDTSHSGAKSSNLPDEEAGRIDSNNCKSEETPKESSGDSSVRFWTNGGLLGLEPSKPPDFNASSSLSQGSLPTKSELDVGSHHKSMQKSNGYKMGQDLSDEVVDRILKEPSSRCLTSNHNDDRACISSKNSGSSQPSNVCSQTERNALGEILPSGAETNHGSSENSSRVFGLGHRLLLNSFQRRISLDERSATSNSLKSILLDESVQNGIVKQSLPETTVKEKVSPGYPIDSLPPSPPLEHMKISFHPVSGHETSKLKLKFPDGSNHHEHIKDVFPSFQLVPESSIPLDDAGSHSDGNDTFCRSSPYISDDCHSLHSDFNSDQWESEETPESSDHGVYDSPHRRSSSESMLSPKEHGDMASVPGGYTTNGVEPSLSVPSLDFPSFENVNPVHEKESSNQSQGNNAALLRINAESAPPPPRPPPPPPTQWRVSKQQLGMTNGTQHYVSEDAEHIHDRNLPQSTQFEQSRPLGVEQMQINDDNYHSHDSIIHKLKDKLDKPKLKSPREVNQLRASKGMDEREDFLHQIRTKSLNLRRTATEKQNIASATGPAASDKVSAILEKANAIRQVVASDDGEDDDDTWSDS